jgi:hypothetical protein
MMYLVSIASFVALIAFFSVMTIGGLVAEWGEARGVVDTRPARGSDHERDDG